MVAYGLTKGTLSRDAITALVNDGVWKLLREHMRVPAIATSK